MRTSGELPVPTMPGFFDRLLGRFTDVHPGEGARATVMLLNIFVIMASYYMIKPLRYPLILAAPVPAWLQRLGVSATGQSEVTSYSAAGTALLMMGFVPAYSWFASRVDHMKLVFGVTLFYVSNIVLFALAVQARVEGVGVLFYIWLALFNMSIVALFWSYANDIYTEDGGHRLFPIIAVGMTAGPPIGAGIAKLTTQMPAHHVLYLVAALLLASIALYEVVNRGASIHHAHHATVAKEVIGGKGAFSLVFASRYILLIAGLFVLLNYVNSIGEYLLNHLVREHAAQAALGNPTFDSDAYVRAFYADYVFWVSVAAVILQLLVTPRVVKRFGLAGVLFVLPFVALGAYAFIALGATIAVVRLAKTAENSTDYSIMNTARQLLWLPTTREEKYKAKQATDTIFVRLGDVLQGVVVYLGTTWLAFGIKTFAALNLVFVVVWLALAGVILRLNRKLSAAKGAEAAGA